MYTKQQRNKIYKEALDKFKKYSIRRDGIAFICTSIKWCGLIEKTEDFCIDDFPEITKRKPKGVIHMAWFPTDIEGVQKRIEIMKQAIAETEN